MAGCVTRSHQGGFRTPDQGPRLSAGILNHLHPGTRVLGPSGLWLDMWVGRVSSSNEDFEIAKEANICF